MLAPNLLQELWQPHPFLPRFTRTFEEALKRHSSRKRGVEFKGGSLHDGFGGFDGFGGSAKHLALLLLLLQNTVPRGSRDGFDGFGGFSTPNMTVRRFHRTTEANPRRPWKAKNPFASRPIKVSINKGTRGVRTRYDTVPLPFISIARCPGRPVIPVPEFRRLWRFRSWRLP